MEICASLPYLLNTANTSFFDTRSLERLPTKIRAPSGNLSQFCSEVYVLSSLTKVSQAWLEKEAA